MKKTVLISLAALAIVTATVWNVTQTTTLQSNEFDALTLANIEALTDGEYEIGFPGTNWQEYTTTCTYTTTIGFDFILQLERTATTTATKTVCGYGTGSCVFAAGC
jgi:hypothetical protein